MRRIVVIANALGPLPPLAAVLARAGFGVPDERPTLDDAADLIRAGHVDLLVIPMAIATGRERVELEMLLREAPHTVVVGTAPSADAEVILNGMRAGVSEFLVSPAQPSDVDMALMRLQRRWGAPRLNGSVIAVYAPKGGVGNTTVAVNLAHTMAARRTDARVLVVDLNMGLGDIVTHLDLHPDYDIGDLARKLDQADAELLHAIVTASVDGLSALPATDDLERADAIQADAVSRVLAACRNSFAHTVVDCEHSFGPRTVAALDAADKIVLVVQSNVAAIRAAKRTLTLFQQLEYPADKIVIVVNREGSGDVLTVADVAKALARSVDVRLPNAYQVAVDAQTRGIPIARLAPNSALAKGFNSLATAVVGEVAVVENADDRNGARKRGSLFGLRRR